MKRVLVLLVALLTLALPGIAHAQDWVNPETPRPGDPVVYVDAKGKVLATFTVQSVERGWNEFDEGTKPKTGTEFVAIAIEVEVGEGKALDLRQEDFDLQYDPGVLVDITNGRSSSADPALLEKSVKVAPGETLAFTLIFRVPEDSPIHALFWVGKQTFLTLVMPGDE